MNVNQQLYNLAQGAILLFPQENQNDPPMALGICGHIKMTMIYVQIYIVFRLIYLKMKLI